MTDRITLERRDGFTGNSPS